jgi:hypothetical protein
LSKTSDSIWPECVAVTNVRFSTTEMYQVVINVRFSIEFVITKSVFAWLKWVVVKSVFAWLKWVVVAQKPVLV